MHKLNLQGDDDSIDFEFFDTKSEKSKLCENEKKYSSKIITKAVIEAKPKEMAENSTLNNIKLKSKKKLSRKNSFQFKTNDCISSPTLSQEKRLLGNDSEDITLFNCLAYNDDVNDSQTINVDEISDNSLSDSTITTVTSDFTSVSRLSSMSDSSCGSDFSSDSPISKNGGGVGTNDNAETIIDDRKDLEIESNMIPTLKEDHRNDSEDLIDEADIFFKSVNSEDEYQNDFHDDQSQRSISPTPSNSESESGKSDCRPTKTSTDEFNHSENTFEEPRNGNQELNRRNSLFRKESSSTIDLEERIGGISLGSQSSSNSSMTKALNNFRGHNRFRSKRRESNLTFSREELIRIERDNTILLKKIMSYSKPKSVLLNHSFSHKKTSAAINRARQQKKIEQDNYILYSKINAMNRMKKVF